MAWESRGAKRYYYRGAWVDGRLVKIYCGSGRRAAVMATQDALARRAAQTDNAAAVAMKNELEPLRRFDDNSDEQMDLLLEAALLAGGCYQHKGEWRKRHGCHKASKAADSGKSERR